MGITGHPSREASHDQFTISLDRLGSQICSRGLAVFDGARDPEAMATLAGRLMSVTAHPDSDEHGVTTIAALGAAALESRPCRRLRPEQRDGQDLILESAERAEAEDEALSMTSRLFFSLVKNDEGARALLLATGCVSVGTIPRDPELHKALTTPLPGAGPLALHRMRRTEVGKLRKEVGVRPETVGGNLSLGQESQAVINDIVGENAPVGVPGGLCGIVGQHVGQNAVGVDRGDRFFPSVMRMSGLAPNSLVGSSRTIENTLLSVFESSPVQGDLPPRCGAVKFLPLVVSNRFLIPS